MDSVTEQIKQWVVEMARTAPIGAAGYSSRDVIIPAAPRENQNAES